MLLASALTHVKALREQLSTLGASIRTSAYLVEDNPDKMLSLYLSTRTTLDEMLSRIDQTNRITMVDGVSLHELRVRRDSLRKTAEFLKSVSTLPSRTTVFKDDLRQTLPIVIDMGKVSGLHNQIAKEARELDETIQKSNWTTELA